MNVPPCGCMKTICLLLIFAVFSSISVLGMDGVLDHVDGPSFASAVSASELANAGETIATQHTDSGKESNTRPEQFESSTPDGDLFLNSSEKFESYFESFAIPLVANASDNSRRESLVLQLPDRPTLRCLHVMLQI